MLTELSAAMVVKNNRYTVEDSVRSIASLVGEVYVVDHGSTDGSAQIVKRLASLLKNVILVSGSEMGYAEARQHIIDNSRSVYILKWDADFIALETTAHSLRQILTEGIEICDSTSANLVVLSALNLGIGLDNLVAERPRISGGDIRMYRRSDAFYIRAEYADSFRMENPRRVYLNHDESPTGIAHLDFFKSPVEIVLRTLRFRWEREGRQVGKSFRDYLREHAPGYNASQIEPIVRRRLVNLSYSSETAYLIGQPEYAPLQLKSPFQYSFDNRGRVVEIALRQPLEELEEEWEASIAC